MGNLNVSVTIPLDENGMMGRECLECEQYFKLKPGTGLETDHCHCPYCDYEGNADTFWTQAQLEYARSIAMQQAFNKIIKPQLNKLTNSFKQLERNSRNSFIQFKVKTSGDNIRLPIKYYSESELETNLTCDNCRLDFAIYGVFSNCPDCNKTNAFLIYEKSLEVIKKKLAIFSKPEIPDDIIEISLSSVLTSSISAFDGLGKELRNKKPDHYPSKPRNLFQNIYVLNEKMDNLISNNHSNFNGLIKYFQIRHIFEHNMGVVDSDCVKKVPELSNLSGRKYKLTIMELDEFIKLMSELGSIIKVNYNK
jgi:Zn finger protein HypA/HybF involved in hydrogenase expression